LVKVQGKLRDVDAWNDHLRDAYCKLYKKQSTGLKPWKSREGKR